MPLPPIPDPKFQLFQQVRIRSKDVLADNATPEVGYITGMYYNDFKTALSQSLPMGWFYTVNFLIAATEEEALKVTEIEQTHVKEKSLEHLEVKLAAAACVQQVDEKKHQGGVNR
jgi:hypothetical protein